MGDLIVKAATGTGNALKLQDQAGQLCFSTIDDGGVITDKVNFPSGHVVQVVEYQGTGASHSHTTTGSWVTVAGGTFTPSITITAGNKIAFFGSYHLVCYNGGADVGFNLRIIDTTNSNQVINADGNSNLTYINVTGTSGNELDTAYPINRLYTPASGTTINFDTQTRANWGGTVQFGVEASCVVMMEIQA